MRRLSLHSLGEVLQHRAFVALLDQAAVSLASFGTGILLSRSFAGAQREQLGLYYLAVTIGILIVELQNALVSTPLTVTAPTLSTEHLKSFIGSALIHQAGLSALITVALTVAAFCAPAMGIGSHESMLFACAITAGAVGLRNFARFLNFALHRSHIACATDWVVSLIQIGGILLMIHLHRLSASSAVIVIGVASLVGGVLALILSSQFIRARLANAWSDFRANWQLSRWVFASGVMGNVGTSVYPWVLDTFSSTLQAAVWGNCNTVSSAGNPVLMGLQNWMAPSIAHAYKDKTRREFQRYVTKLAALFILILVPMLIVLLVVTKPLLHHLYRDDTADTTRLVLLLAAGSLVQAVGFTFTRGLFSLGRGGLDVWTNVIPVIVLFAVGIPLVHFYGAVGGAWSLLIAQAGSSLVRGVLFWNVCTDRPVSGADKNVPNSISAAVPLEVA